METSGGQQGGRRQADQKRGARARPSRSESRDAQARSRRRRVEPRPLVPPRDPGPGRRLLAAREGSRPAGRRWASARRALRGLLAEALDRAAGSGSRRSPRCSCCCSLIRFVAGARRALPDLAVKECAPADESFAFVPADALLYAHLTIDDDSDQFERSSEAFEQLPDLRTILTAELPGALPTPSGTPVDISAGRAAVGRARPGADAAAGPGRELAAGLHRRGRGPGRRRGVPRPRSRPPARRRRRQVGDEELSVYDGRLRGRLRRATPSSSASEPRRAGQHRRRVGRRARARGQPTRRPRSATSCPTRASPRSTCRAPGSRALLAGRAGAATQLETFVDYGATRRPGRGRRGQGRRASRSTSSAASTRSC